MRIAVAVILLLVGCSKPNPNYCVGEDCPDLPPKACTVSEGDCVCLDGGCVQCTPTDEHNCTDARKPQCGTDNTCRACRANDDCDSGACLEDGSCAAATAIIMASPTGVSTPSCGVAPAQDCSITQAVAELTTARNVIRLAPGTYSVTIANPDGVDFGQKSGTLVARDATITRSGGIGPLVTVRNGQSLKLVGGILQGPASADGIRCYTGGKLQVHETVIEKMTESGIETDSCDFTVSRAVIRRNGLGGISMVNTFRVATITNNFVYRNGQLNSSLVGGMMLKLAAGSKLEFNTVVDNQSDTGTTSAGGIVCTQPAGTPAYDAPYNLVYRNQGGLGGTYQVFGDCTFQGSYQRTAATPDENAILLERPNDSQDPSYRLTSASPSEVRDHEVAGYTCNNLIDFEGDERPAGSFCDCGADELRARP